MRCGTRFPAQDPIISWTGAGPPGAGSVFNVFPLYKLCFDPGFACAIAMDEKANTAARLVIDNPIAFRIPLVLAVDIFISLVIDFGSGRPASITSVRSATAPGSAGAIA
jgi:hypothetical protein